MFRDAHQIMAVTRSEFLTITTDCGLQPLKCVVAVTLLRSTPTGHYRATIHLTDRARFIDEEVGVEVQLPSFHFLRQPGLVVGRAQDSRHPATHELTLRHRGDMAPLIEDVVVDASLGEFLEADIIRQDTGSTTVRISETPAAASQHTVSASLTGYLIIRVAGERPEEFRIPVTWCKST